MENVRQQNDWLNKELQEKMQELMICRKEKVNSTFSGHGVCKAGNSQGW